MKRVFIVVLALAIAGASSAQTQRNEFEPWHDHYKRIEHYERGKFSPSWDTSQYRSPEADMASGNFRMPLTIRATTAIQNVDYNNGVFTEAELESLSGYWGMFGDMSRWITPWGQDMIDDVAGRNPNIQVMGYTRFQHNRAEGKSGPGGASGAGNMATAYEGDVLRDPGHRMFIDNVTQYHIMWISAAGDTLTGTNVTTLVPSFQDDEDVGGFEYNEVMMHAAADTIARYIKDFWTSTTPLRAAFVDHLSPNGQTYFNGLAAIWNSNNTDLDLDGTPEYSTATRWNMNTRKGRHAYYQWFRAAGAYGEGFWHHLGREFAVAWNGATMVNDWDSNDLNLGYQNIGVYERGTNGWNKEGFGWNGTLYDEGGTAQTEWEALIERRNNPGQIKRDGTGSHWFTVAGRHARTVVGSTIKTSQFAAAFAMMYDCIFYWNDDITLDTTTAYNYLEFPIDFGPTKRAGQPVGDVVVFEGANGGTHDRYVREYTRGWIRLAFLNSTGAVDSLSFDLK